MKTRNRIFVVLFAASLLFCLRLLTSVKAHDGHKHSNAPVSAKKLKNPLQAGDDEIAAGKQVFNKQCAACHGEDGKSKTDIATAMKKRPTDLTAKEMSGITDGEIYWVVTNGVTKTGMPAFKAKASTNERWQVTLYVKHLMGEHAGHGGVETVKATAQDHLDHEAAVNTRGDQVMGFDHEKTTHHFRLRVDGGIIEVEANDPNDTVSRDQIRVHLQHITRKFAVGDFTAPMLIHAQSPPGLPVMKRMKAAIKYQFEGTERGGRVRIATRSSKALAAIHEFLRFQISDHRTGDSPEVERTP